jgi:DNA-binding GntR family transcriptional regulator
MPSGENRPKYQRIADVLRAAVAAGTYGPGDRLPGENELMAEHGVARMTARQALGLLQSEGIAEARKGAGVFVREFRPVRRRGIARLAREGWSAGRSVWETDLDAAEAEALALPTGTPVVLLRRTAYARDERVVEVNDMVLDSGAYVLEYAFGA